LSGATFTVLITINQNLSFFNYTGSLQRHDLGLNTADGAPATLGHLWNNIQGAPVVTGIVGAAGAQASIFGTLTVCECNRQPPILAAATSGSFIQVLR